MLQLEVFSASRLIAARRTSKERCTFLSLCFTLAAFGRDPSVSVTPWNSFSSLIGMPAALYFCVATSFWPEMWCPSFIAMLEWDQ